jgi:hypothetical protein
MKPSKQQIIMPLQPIENGRFIPNRIVETLLMTSTLDLNKIACMDFTNQERMQFAQLIGNSLSGLSELSYVDDETYEAALKVSGGADELTARNEVLRKQIKKARTGLKIATCALFEIHPDDLNEKEGGA